MKKILFNTREQPFFSLIWLAPLKIQQGTDYVIYIFHTNTTVIHIFSLEIEKLDFGELIFSPNVL